MSTLVICNVGTRDVVIAGKEDEKPLPKARIQGEYLLAQLATAVPEVTPDALTFPILKPALDAILAEEASGRIDRLVLIGTNQDEAITPPWHRQNDTLFYAQLARQVLIPRFGAQIGQAQVIEVGAEKSPINPALYDHAYNRLGEIVGGLADPDVTCYVAPVGGIPALNTALILQGVRFFGERCRVRFVTEEGRPYSLKAGEQVVAMMQEHTAVDRLLRLDFVAALPLLSTGRGPRDPVTPLIHYASARLWFDFDQAQRYLNDAAHYAREQPAVATQLATEQQALQRLRGGDSLALLGELYFNALIAWENGRFIDFLGRATRFHEALLLYLAQEYAPHLLRQASAKEIATNPEKRHWLQNALANLSGGAAAIPEEGNEQMRRLRQQINRAFSLEEVRILCFDLRIPYEDLQGDGRAGKIVGLLDHALRYGTLPDLLRLLREERPQQRWEIGWETPATAPLPALLPILERLARLWPLRQQSIIAHGYGGVSQQALAQAYNSPPGPTPESPVQDMFEAGRILGMSDSNPLLRVRDLLLALLGHTQETGVAHHD